MATHDQLQYLRARVLTEREGVFPLWNRCVQILIQDSATRAAFLAVDPEQSEGGALRLVQAVMPGAETAIVIRFDRCSVRISTYKRKLLTGDADRTDGKLWRAIVVALIQLSIAYDAA